MGIKSEELKITKNKKTHLKNGHDSLARSIIHGRAKESNGKVLQLLEQFFLNNDLAAIRAVSIDANRDA